MIVDPSRATFLQRLVAMEETITPPRTIGRLLRRVYESQPEAVYLASLRAVRKYRRCGGTLRFSDRGLTWIGEQPEPHVTQMRWPFPSYAPLSPHVPRDRYTPSAH